MDDDIVSKSTVILVTGCAGFIGMHTAIALLRAGHKVVGVDNFNGYYDPRLKRRRIANIRETCPDAPFEFHQADIENEGLMRELARNAKPEKIVHLAAQPGARYSIEHPMAYAHSNLMGMTVLLELARQEKVSHFVYASSSSVYGGNTKVPYSESDRVDTPVSFYAATKLANEMMAASYASLYDVPMTGLRFFTVYGPWGRPDMAPWLFTKAIVDGHPIKVFGNGTPERDYTYIDDIVDGLCRILNKPADKKTEASLHRVLNIGNQQPVRVSRFIEIIEEITGATAQREMLPMQAGDVQKTFASVDLLDALVGFKPATSLEDGLKNFVDWFNEYHADQDHT